MKIIILSLSLFLITSCASTPYEPLADQGFNCRPYQGSQKDTEPMKKTCINVDYGYDPVRFHYVPSWDRNRLPSMPDLD